MELFSKARNCALSAFLLRGTGYSPGTPGENRAGEAVAACVTRCRGKRRRILDSTAAWARPEVLDVIEDLAHRLRERRRRP